MSQARYGMPLVVANGTSVTRLVGFGGSPTSSAATWSYTPSSNTWTALTPTQVPASGRTGHCEAYLPTQNQLLVVGGHDDTGAAQTTPLLLDLGASAWVTLAGVAPAPLTGCAAAWFPRTSTAVIFGGATSTITSGDTWTFDPLAQTFTVLNPATVPPARSGAAIAYDPGGNGEAAAESLLLFDGVGPDGEIDDLWRWDGTTWGELATASDPDAMYTDNPRPLGRANAQVALDATRRLLYVFGGLRDGVELNDLWRLDLATLGWQNLPTTSGPTAREQASTTYDPVGDRMLIIGGLGQDAPLSDGWILAPVK